MRVRDRERDRERERVGERGKKQYWAVIIKYSNVYATTDYHEIFLQNAEISKIEKDGVEPLFIFEILEITFTKGILKEFRDISTTKNVFTYLSNVMTSCAFSYPKMPLIPMGTWWYFSLESWLLFWGIDLEYGKDT